MARHSITTRWKLVTVPLAISEQAGPEARSTFRSHAVDLLLLLGLASLALAVRLQHLLTVPRFTDEQLDVLYTLPLYRLQALPLVGFDPYNGPLLSYLLAGWLWIIGPRPESPRLLVTTIAVATVVVTYLLGRILGGRLAGLVAAGLLATCATHVIVNSHIAWSNATTPFFTTLAVLVLTAAISRASGRLLALAGLAFGLALQTHPSVIAMLPGAGLAVLIRRPALLWTRWALLAAALFVLVYSPVMAANLYPPSDLAYRQAVSGLVPESRVLSGGLAGRLTHEQEMNADSGAGPISNAALLGLSLPRVAASLIEPKPAWSSHLLVPAFWIYGALVVAGLVWLAWRGRIAPFLVILSFLTLLAVINNKYEPIFNGRYIMPALPIVFVGAGLLAADLWRVARRTGFRLILAAILAGLLFWPLVPLQAYFGRNAADGVIDLDLIQSAAVVASARSPDELVLLDEALGRRGLSADGDLLQNLRLFLELKGIPYRVGALSVGKIDGELGGARRAIVAVAQPYARELDDRFRFAALEERTAGRYAIYRLERR